MATNTEQVESSALKVGVFINVLMAVAGWVTYSITGSEALLLDGNFSFISALTIIGAIIIIQKKHKRTPMFPYGRYFFESLFTVSKGILILGLTIAALFQNIIKIIEFTEGKSLERLQTGPIIIYMALMLLLCFGTAIFYEWKNKKINYRSSILRVEGKASKIDGYMTIAVGAALILSTIVPESSIFSFLLYIGDAIIVILMCFFLLRIPLEVIKEGFIELGGGSVQDKDAVKQIEQVINNLLPNPLEIIKYHLSKTGSSHLLLIYVKSKTSEINVASVDKYRSEIHQQIEANFPNSEIEIVFRA